jgi:hypothetical protein
LTKNCLKITTLGFLYNLLPDSCGKIGFLKKKHRSSIGLKMPLLPVVFSGIPDTAASNWKKCAKQPLPSAADCFPLLDEQHSPPRYNGVFFNGRETL